MHEKGHEVLFAVHTDQKHIHVHFLISNCNFNTGKSYRRNKKDLWDMSAFLGEKCVEYGLENSIRDDFYKDKDKDNQRDKITFAEKKMTERGKETFKEELREVIREEIQNPANKTLDDVVNALLKNYSVETRIAGNTISYRHPEYQDKNNNLVSVRGSKLGDSFTVKGISHELEKSKRRKHSLLNADIPAARTVEPNNAARRIEPIMGANNVLGIGQTTGGRGQIPSDVNVRNNEPNLQSLDGFYDRYRKTVEDNKHTTDKSASDNERETVKAVEPPKRVRNKGAR